MAGANVKATDSDGYKTALHFACESGHVAVAAALIEKHGADPEAKDRVRPWRVGVVWDGVV